MTIGEFSRAAGVPISTVRYYEQARLVRPSGRSGASLSSEEDLQRLRFVRAAQATGFTLDDIKQLLFARSLRSIHPLWADSPARRVWPSSPS